MLGLISLTVTTMRDETVRKTENPRRLRKSCEVRVSNLSTVTFESGLTIFQLLTSP